MVQLSHVEGVESVINHLKKWRKGYEGRFKNGMVLAGLHLQRASQKIVPVNDGNLKASAFTRAFGKGFDTDVIVGYTAAYAVYVHENLEAAHGSVFNAKYAAQISKKLKGFKARGPDQQAKFLTEPMIQLRSKLLQIIAKVANR